MGAVSQGSKLAIAMPSKGLKKSLVATLNRTATEIDQSHKTKLKNLHRINVTFRDGRKNVIAQALRSFWQMEDLEWAQCLDDESLKDLKKYAVLQIFRAFESIFIDLKEARKQAKLERDNGKFKDKSQSKPKNLPLVVIVYEMELVRRKIFRSAVKQQREDLKARIWECIKRHMRPAFTGNDLNENTLSEPFRRALKNILQVKAPEDGGTFSVQILQPRWSFRGIFLARHYGITMKYSILPYVTHDLKSDGIDFITSNRKLIEYVIALIREYLPYFGELQDMLNQYLTKRFHKDGIPLHQTPKPKPPEREEAKGAESDGTETDSWSDSEGSETEVSTETNAKAKSATAKTTNHKGMKLAKKIIGLPIRHFFSTLVYNRHCQTFPHKDSGDLPQGWCVVVPFGGFTGGNLRLIDTGLEFHVESGQVIAFKSALLTHSNAQFHGFRNSLVFYTDKRLYDWLEGYLKERKKTRTLKRFYELMTLQFDAKENPKPTPKSKPKKESKSKPKERAKVSKTKK
ncbi:hypothetical protein HDU96_005941 [Phlyctochytrium bullatum]|nr:hypothetical protein HDU96_005941 [Phlyctochytrium bullatum]